MLGEVGKCPNCAGKLVERGNKKICIYCDAEFYFSVETKERIRVQKVSLENHDSFEKEKWKEPLMVNQGEIVKEVCINYICDLAARLNIKITDKNQELMIDPKKGNRAREYFKIPGGEEIYLLHDSTVFGSGKKGFAICENGFYYRADDKTCGVISWDLFSKVNIEFNKNILKVGGKEFFCGTGDGTYEVLLTIKERLKSSYKQFI